MNHLHHGLVGLATAVALISGLGVEKAVATAVPADCAGITSVAGWLAVGPCQIGDKIFTLDADHTDVGLALPVAFSSDALAGTHAVTFSPDSFRPGIVAYTVAIVDSDREIWKIALDIDGPGRLASKEIRATFDGDVIAALAGGGGPASEALVVGDVFHITDRFVMESATVLSSVTNVFFQRDRDVPVPATALLLGAGLAALAASRRRGS